MNKRGNVRKIDVLFINDMMKFHMPDKVINTNLWGGLPDVTGKTKATCRSRCGTIKTSPV
jgi:hypothetical protein